MYWVDIHETTPCLVFWIPDITDRSTLQLKPFNQICIKTEIRSTAARARGRARPEESNREYNDSLAIKLIMF